MTRAFSTIGRWLLAFVMIAALGTAPAQQKRKPYLQIISPANGSVIRPGRRFTATVRGDGEYPVGIVLLGEELVGAVESPLGKEPWVVPIEVPLSAPLGKTSLTAMSATASGEDVVSNELLVDIEPVEIPPVKFGPLPALVRAGDCITVTSAGAAPCGSDLEIEGTYPDGTKVHMNESTRITMVSQDPSIAYINGGRSLIVGRSPGSTKITFFGKYSLDVKVYGQPLR